MSDLRNLPEPVLERLQDLDLGDRQRTFNGFDITQRGNLLEARTFTALERRLEEDGTPVTEGYATVYGRSYDVLGGPDMGGFRETIADGAATKSVRDRDNVFLLFDHDGVPMASIRGGGLKLWSDSTGLGHEARLDPRSTSAMDIYYALERGDLDSMSFAFRVMQGGQTWNDDYTERTITEVRLYDVSVVKFPANPYAIAQPRSTEPVLQESRGMSLSLARAQYEALSLHI